MTAGHQHRLVRVKDGGLVHRALRYPLLTTGRAGWVKNSIFVFGPVEDAPGRWNLTLLGILHGLTGLTLTTQRRPER